MDPAAVVDILEYGESLSVNGVRLSLHPAGHILGAAQVRVENRGQVWVVSGDYKVEADDTCRMFEPVRCQTFISECTFGLPVYRWPSQAEVFAQINDWWQANRRAGRASVIFAYALGKAQRILAGIDATIGPIYCHGAVERVNADYRTTGVRLPETRYAGRGNARNDFSGALIVAPPSAMATAWLRKFGESSSAFASGWMLIRGTRRRRSVDRGFVLSDHADWTGLNETVSATGAEQVLLTHGQTAPMTRWLTEQGFQASALTTRFEGEQDESGDAQDHDDAPPGETESAGAESGEAES